MASLCVSGGRVALGIFVIGALLVAGRAPVLAARGRGTEGLVASPEAGWPQWRGPRRDGVSREKGLLQSWPEGGPRLLWRVEGIGTGWSSPVVSRGRIYITGDVGDDLVIQAFDRNGRRLWQAKNGAAWKGDYPGARACGALSEGRLYHLNAHGRLACLDAATGREVWAVNVLERFGGQNITWGISECLLVDGRRVLVTPGGTQALMAALDKRTGETLWRTEPIPGEQAAYTSPILFRWGGRRLVTNCSSRYGFGVDAETGKLLWKVPVEGRFRSTVSTPVYAGGAVFYTTPDGSDGALYRLRPQGDGVEAELAWRVPLDSLTGGVVHVDDRIYFGGYRRTHWWHVVEWQTGQPLGQLREVIAGAPVYADGRFHCLAQDGTVVLLRPTPEGGLAVAGQFRLVEAKSRDAWAHPVLVDGRLYLRYHDTLWCYDVKAR
ncbi:MAG: PQQ-binding-like beta-propeller repeat protein [Armatimonadetes bacterium]|nr:PQQ-binding-like beta-propeller repeat protein [Armatimonadota bacterium]